METDEFEKSSKKIKLSSQPKQKNPEPELATRPSIFPMTCFQLRPKKCVDRSFEVKPSPVEFIKEITDIEGVSKALESLEKSHSLYSQVDRSQQYPKVVFLGTGSCIPNKTRNVSSILVHTTYESNSFLLYNRSFYNVQYVLLRIFGLFKIAAKVRAYCLMWVKER